MTSTVTFVGALEPSQIGVDYLSATATDLHVAGWLWKRGCKLVDIERGSGQTVRPWAWNGYQGWATTHAKVGVRQDSTYAQLGGSAAFYGWLALLDRPVNVTRIDVQVTVGGVPLWCDLAHEAFERIDGNGDLAREARTYSWYGTRPAGSTLYIGSTKSEQRLRLYDKTAESQGAYPPGTWRYEVQARDGLAGSIAAAMAHGYGSAIAGDVQVYERFLRRGCKPTFRPSGRSLLGNVTRSERDTERTLRWLDRSVRPAIYTLAGKGLGDRAFRALGVVVEH